MRERKIKTNKNNTLLYRAIWHLYLYLSLKKTYVIDGVEHFKSRNVVRISNGCFELRTNVPSRESNTWYNPRYSLMDNNPNNTIERRARIEFSIQARAGREHQGNRRDCSQRACARDESQVHNSLIIVSPRADNDNPPMIIVITTRARHASFPIYSGRFLLFAALNSGLWWIFRSDNLSAVSLDAMNVHGSRFNRRWLMADFVDYISSSLCCTNEITLSERKI